MNMMRSGFTVLIAVLCCAIFSCKDDEGDNNEQQQKIQLATIRVGTYELDLADFTRNTAAPTDKPIVATFSTPLDAATTAQAVKLTVKSSGQEIPVTISYLDNNKTFSALPATALAATVTYVLTLDAALKGAAGETFPGYKVEFSTVAGTMSVTSIKMNGTEVLTTSRITDAPIENLTFDITFSTAVDPATITSQSIKVIGTNAVPVTLALSESNKKLTVSVTQTLADYRKYQLWISGELVKGAAQETLAPFSKNFYTALNPTPDFDVITDDALLTLVQLKTFNYFWDYAHPVSGMARERLGSGDVVTSGGTGFGIMSIIVGIQRGFITRQQGLDRMDKILGFLETADRFHGAWSHWINGTTGKVIPFSTNDNGGDLVETSFLVQGLITFRQYLNVAEPAEQSMANRINTLWQAVEWDWYTRSGQKVLYWHWSPDKDWVMNMPIKGYNEALITYFLAAASPAHSINADVYHQGWAGNGSIQNGKTFYNITLPLGYDYGGPLFFTHYSFLGLDPRELSDTYANYWTQNVNHTLINHAYCVANPSGYVGYGEDCWGLTASDNQDGYSAHSPTNDLGVITPTAALSSFPYAPEQAMKALKFFYYTVGDRLWGEYGFYDAFNLTDGWTAGSYLAIDQGPIVVMIENHRTNLLWNLFMSAPEVQTAKTKLAFN